MKTTRSTPISLHRETLRLLADSELNLAEGGMPPPSHNCSNLPCPQV